MTRFAVREKLGKASVKAKSKMAIGKAALGLATVSVLVLGTIQAASAAAIQPVTTTLPGNDDGSTGAVDFGFTANLSGRNYNTLYVNNNGNVTFDSPLSTFTPFNLTTTNTKIIAPFFADVDTRASNPVTYGRGTLDGRNAFNVNWVNVGYFPQQTDKLNSFQLVLKDRADTGAGNFDIIFNYDKIKWETGSSSGGSNGLGGTSARAGFYLGNALPRFELFGSGVNGAFLDSNQTTGLINNRLGSGVDGRYVFPIRNGNVSPVPEPMTILGTLTAAGFGVALRRKQKQQQKATAKV